MANGSEAAAVEMKLRGITIDVGHRSERVWHAAIYKDGELLCEAHGYDEASTREQLRTLAALNGFSPTEIDALGL